MTEWLAAGFGEDLFWSLTPRQVHTHIAAMTLRNAREQQARAWSAWHTAALSRTTRLPRLEDIAGRVGAPAIAIREQIRDIARTYTVMMGGAITDRK